MHEEFLYLWRFIFIRKECWRGNIFQWRAYSKWKRYLFGKNGTQLGKGLDYGPALEFFSMLGVCRPVLQILILFQTKNCPFSHPFSDLASKIHTHSRDRPLRHYVWSSRRFEQQQKRFLKTDLCRIRVFLFLSYSFGIEPINTFVQSCSSLENHTRFKIKMNKVYTRFQTKTAQKGRAFWAVLLIYGLYSGVPPGGGGGSFTLSNMHCWYSTCFLKLKFVPYLFPL